MRPVYLDPNYRRFMLGQVGKLRKVYGVEANYIDAEVGDRYADWPTHTWIQPYHRYEFLRAYRRASGKELPLIRNSPNAPYASGAYWEGRGLSSEGMEQRWRAVGGKMLVDKIVQWQHRWTALMRWGWGPPNEPYYTNYLIGLGYKPHAPGEPIRKAAYLQAAFEMRHLTLLDAKFSPCFWRNEQTDTEVYLLRQGNAVFASCIDHAFAPRSVTIAIQSAGLPFKQGNSLFAWQLQIDDPSHMPEDLNEEFQRRTTAKQDLLGDARFLRQWTQRRVVRNRFLGEVPLKQGLKLSAEVRPKLLTMIAVSEVPALVFGEGAQEGQMQVPCTADVTISGTLDRSSRTLDMRVDSQRPCRIAVLASAAGTRVQSAVVCGRACVGIRKVIGDSEYLVLPVPAKGAKISVRYGRS